MQIARTTSSWHDLYVLVIMRCLCHPNLKEEVGGLIPDCEISSLVDKKNCQVVNCLLYFGVGMSAFCLKKKK